MPAPGDTPIRRAVDLNPAPFDQFEPDAVAPPAVPMTPADLDALADRVIARIERRVVDELERRGRRHRRGEWL